MAIDFPIHFTRISEEFSWRLFQGAKRTADFALSLILLVILLPVFALIALSVLSTSGSPVLYWSRRYGRDNEVFPMPKFRTMKLDTPEMPSRELQNPTGCLLPLGGFLRKSSLDELPQLWNILCGNMSFVGPRPVILAEEDVASQRDSAGVSILRPGLTGWAQIHGRDHVDPNRKVALDKHYLENQSVLLDLKIVALTMLQVLRSEGVSH
jgi:O-antigen biosynthesis protein WbqP